VEEKKLGTYPVTDLRKSQILSLKHSQTTGIAKRRAITRNVVISMRCLLNE
jgi:hypothetical protein